MKGLAFGESYRAANYACKEDEEDTNETPEEAEKSECDKNPEFEQRAEELCKLLNDRQGRIEILKSFFLT